MKTNLLIIDIQKCFINKNTKDLPGKIEKLQKNYKNIFVASFINKKDSFFEKNLNWTKCKKNSVEANLVFSPFKKSIFIKHSNYSCLTNELTDILEKMKITDIDICGMDTDACVLKTAFDLVENNFKIRILENFTASSGGEVLHRNALTIINRNLGKCII